MIWKTTKREVQVQRRGLESWLYIFHDENYLQDKDNFEEHKQEVAKRLMDKVINSTDHNEGLFILHRLLSFTCRN